MIDPTTLPLTTVGDNTGQQFTAEGGLGRGYSFSATGLPTGMSLSTGGWMSGHPHRPWDRLLMWLLQSLIAMGIHRHQSYSLDVDPAITMSPTTLPVLTVGDSFSQQLTASGVRHRLQLRGDWCSGRSDVEQHGLLSGTPTDADSFTMDVTLTDGIMRLAICRTRSRLTRRSR